MGKKAILKLTARVSLLLVMLSICGICNAKIIYVDDSASGAKNGSSWIDAYIYLQDALTEASSGDEIRVAHGIYTPDMGAAFRPGDSNATFQLKNGVTIKGGYVGLDIPQKSDERAFNIFETILSADLNGEDNPDDPSSYIRSKNVVTGSNTDETAILDGCTILGVGQSNPGAYLTNTSGNPTIKDCKFSIKKSSNFNDNGFYNNNSNPTIINCIFELDSTFTPSEYSTFIAMKNVKSNPVLIDCIFRNNQYCMDNSQSNIFLNNCVFINNSKAVIKQNSGSLKIKGCTFTGNTFIYRSLPTSCIVNSSGNLTIQDSTFTNNSYNLFDVSYSEGCGCIYNPSGNLTLSNCTFSSNSGGVIISNSTTINNCDFINNSIDFYGGIIHGSGLKIYNCRLSGNSSTNPGILEAFNSDIHNCIFEANTNTALAIHPGVYRELYNCVFYGNSANPITVMGNSRSSSNTGILNLTNCIIRNNDSNVLDENKINATYCNVEGGCSGEGNIDIDPLFAKAGYWADANDIEVVVDKDDPNAVWIMGDYHLKSIAGRWDSESESWVKDDISSPCIDAGNINSPIGYEPFPNGGICNIGAYGRSDQASKTYFENNDTGVILAADINGDSIVDNDDLNIVISQWLLEGKDFINQPPLVTLLEPQEGDQITWTGKLILQAQASDLDGEISGVSFYLEHKSGGMTYGTSCTGKKEGDIWVGETSFGTVFHYGEWTISAHATDNEGLTAGSDATINIVAP